MPAHKSSIVTGIRPCLYALLLLFCFSCVSAQPGTSNASPKLNKKDQQTFAKARSQFDIGDFVGAKDMLDRLIKKNPSFADLYFLRALTFKERGDYQGAVDNVTQGLSKETKNKAIAQRQLGELYAKLGEFDNSLASYEAYLAGVSSSVRAERTQKAQALVEKARIAADIASRPVPFKASPLSGGINTTEHLEYFPSLSLDGKSMIFTRRVYPQENEDFYRSDRLEDGSWSEAVPLEGINTALNEGAQSITADGNFLVFTMCGGPVNRGSCDLYFSERTENGWTNAQGISRNINTEAYEAQPSISADGRLLFFSSDRAGGQGSEDLYVSGRMEDGQWTVPSNLGPTINTRGKEQYPFWAADGKTLYFTSNNHPGLGGEDLFKTQLTPQNTWTKPENLGYPINTAHDETNLFISLNGSTAFFSKQYVNPAVGKRDVDIFSFELPLSIRPNPATYLEATVIDKKSRQPIMANVRVSPISADAPPSFFRTGEDGSFLTVMPTGKDYALTVNEVGYVFYSDRFTLSGKLVPEEPFRLTIELEQVEEIIASGGTEEDGSTAFKNVLFETGSATLLPVSAQELDRLVELLLEASNFQVEIAGHTDDVGDDSANQRLSEARANSVKIYLQENGVNERRITTLGYGESRPVADNASEAGRTENRRTTFRLIR